VKQKLGFLFGIVHFIFMPLMASDAITIDSIFKNNKGFRSVTTIDFISSGGSRTFTSYPALIGIEDGNVLVDSKTFSLNETILYAYNSKIDIVINANGSYQNLQYADTSGFSNKDSSDFGSLWLGVNYQFDSIFGEFKPDITLQIPVFEKYTYRDEKGSSSLKAFSAKLSFKNYSDPLVSTFYISVLKNFEKEVGINKIVYPDSYGVGFDLSLILNPKASLNFNFAQRYQTELEENGVDVNPTTTLPTIGIGITYSINENNSFTVSSSVGSGANSPDSIVSASLWHKF
jgi:hypothetical protein